MSHDQISIAASMRLREGADHMDAYIITSGSRPYCIASLILNTEVLGTAWREEFRSLCQHIVEESFNQRGFRPVWIEPQSSP